MRPTLRTRALPSDQRLNGRYPIILELQYKLLNKGRVEHFGVGRTLNISSGGVLFETADGLPSAAGPIELALNWPFMLEGICNLKLVMRGRIVRCDATSKAFAVKTDYHEFHTTGVRSTKSRTMTASAVS
jgi:hypothetical protein